MEPTLKARLGNLTDEAFERMAKRFEALRDGGGKMVEKQEVIRGGVRVTFGEGGGLDVTFTEDGARLEATVGALGFPEDWEAYDRLQMAFENGADSLILHFVLVGARCRMIDRRQVAPHAKETFDIDLVDLPLAQANHPPHQPTAVRVIAQWGDTWPTEGARMCAGNVWPATANSAPVSAHIREIRLLPRANKAPRPIVDRFGQRIHGNWPTKVRDDTHMKQAIEEERRWLAETREHPGRDTYGGWTGGPTFEPSGFFRVERDPDGRWWYVDPLGNPFWSVGTTGVRIADATIVEGREHFFEELPDPDGPYGVALNPPITSRANDPKGKKAVSFYYLNVLRKWGSEEAWRDHVTLRFRRWGFNTIGNWSQESVLQQRVVPHTCALDTRPTTVPMVAGSKPDVWDPGWLEIFDRHVAESVEPLKDNPWLLGYFCDNELGWRRLHRRLLECSQEACARDAFMAFIRSRYHSVASFNRDFGTDCASWEGARALGPEAVPEAGPAQEAMLDFAGEYADRYFRLVSETIRKHDPNHLYLGCRFVRGKPEDRICAAAGRYADMITVNSYDLWPRREQFSVWHEACGRKPIQIGEHSFPLVTERQVPPLYSAFSERERSRLYVELVRKWADQPYALGCHWYQYADQHITGRPSDGENQPSGFVDITDRPYPEMVKAARRATAHMYEWHAT